VAAVVVVVALLATAAPAVAAGRVDPTVTLRGD
jgi:ABC-type lipoprotein release transport system permease subunit